MNITLKTSIPEVKKEAVVVTKFIRSMLLLIGVKTGNFILRATEQMPGGGPASKHRAQIRSLSRRKSNLEIIFQAGTARTKVRAFLKYSSDFLDMSAIRVFLIRKFGDRFFLDNFTDEIEKINQQITVPEPELAADLTETSKRRQILSLEEQLAYYRAAAVAFELSRSNGSIAHHLARATSALGMDDISTI